jgi:hypothetical protein
VTVVTAKSLPNLVSTRSAGAAASHHRRCSDRSSPAGQTAGPASLTCAAGLRNELGPSAGTYRPTAVPRSAPRATAWTICNDRQPAFRGGRPCATTIPMIRRWFCSGCLRSGSSPAAAAGRPTPSGATAARQSQLTVDKQTSRYRPTERVGEKAEGGSMK